MIQRLTFPARRKPLKALTPKQLRFIEEYLLDHNATQAAIRAGYKGKYIDRLAHQLLEKTRDVLKVRLKEQREELRGKVSITRERWLKELICWGFYDPGKMFDNGGKPFEIAEMPPHLRRAIAGFEFYEDFQGKGESRRPVGYTKKFRFVDKLTALKQLGEALGFTEPETDGHGSGNGPRTIRVEFVDGETKKDMNLPPKVVNPSNPQVTFGSNHGDR